MARIRKEEYPRIRHLVDVERRPVREIAAEFGCTAAAIYGILAKLRRQGESPETGSEAETDATADSATLPSVPTAGAQAQPSLVLDSPSGPAIRVVDSVAESPAPNAATQPADAPVILAFEPPPGKPAGAMGRVDAPPARTPPRAAATAPLGGRLARPGIGLVMRTEDGEETMTPFRSIDDLLSAIKPILRATARSPEPVWFSLQAVDLSAIEVDAA
jgi:hypothetical protein